MQNKKEFQTYSENIIFIYSSLICGKSMKNYYLSTHVKTVHDGRKDHKCDLCEKSFSQAGHLSKHIKFVHEGIGYTCDICGHKTSTARNLKLHITRKHNK